MQAAKDSFYSALRDRLAVVDPLRTAVVEGIVRPAVVVVENELATTNPAEPNTFYITWNGASHAMGSLSVAQPMIELDCAIAYWTEGSDALSYQDRGRTMAALDEELLAIASPENAKLQDFTATPPTDLLANVFWTAPELGKVVEDGHKLLRQATLKVFYLSETNG